jgi:hypothetical protein
MTMKTLKIEIRRQATLGGNVYYNLYVNNQYQTLSSKLEEMEDKAKLIEALFLAGEMDEHIVYAKDLAI